MKSKKILKVLGMIVLGALAVIAFGGIVMLLWNWLVPSIIGWRAINWWEAMGILILSKILFGGHGGKGGGRCKGNDRHYARWQAKWESMTPEERAKLKAEWDRKCGKRWNNTPNVPPSTSSSDTPQGE